MSKKLTTMEFIRKEISIHDKKFGDFEQTPDFHIRGNECLRCRTDGTRLTKEEFIKKSKIMHCVKNNISLYIIRYDDDIKERMSVILKNNQLV